MNEYEFVYILQPGLDDEGIQAAIDRLDSVITGAEGEVVSTERWGSRKLAYPIKRFFEGYYVLQQLSMPAAATHVLERTLRINEDVLRHMLLRADK
jgi:small subunit ribosomal protein S6